MDHVAVRVPGLAEEFRGVSLGDHRLDVRLGLILTSIEGGCSSSSPDIFENDSQLEAFYRFTNNDRIALDDLLAPHRNETVNRINQHRTVLAVHDSSEFAFNGERGEGLYKLRNGKSGFIGDDLLDAAPVHEPRHSRARAGTRPKTSRRGKYPGALDPGG